MASILTESFALVVTGMLFISYIVVQKVFDRRSRIFIAMVLTNAIALVCDLITWIFDGQAYTTLLYVANFFVFSLGYVIIAQFTQFQVCFIKKKQRADRWLLPLIYGNCMVATLLVVVSCFNRMYFYVEDGTLEHGPLGWLAVLYSMGIVLLDMLLTWLHRKELGKKNAAVFLSYGLIPIFSFVIQIFVTDLTVTWLGSTLMLLFIYLVVHADYARELTERKLEISETRATLLLSQIRPHFLFNTLNGIYELCDADPQKAQTAIGEFSEYLRENLSILNNIKPISFDMELTYLKHYLSLEKMRFEDRVQVVYDIRESLFFLPALTVQPLVENAIKHGMHGSNRRLTIHVSTRLANDCYRITIQDDGVGFDVEKFYASQRESALNRHENQRWEEQTHVGLENVKARLHSMCDGELFVTSSPGRGTTVVVEIPQSWEVEQ